MSKTKIPLVIVLLIMVSGCAGIAKGVTQAILERSEEEDTLADLDVFRLGCFKHGFHMQRACRKGKFDVDLLR